MRLQRAFSSFPSGWAGAALLMLRVVVGMCAIGEAGLAMTASYSPLNLSICFFAALTGVALVLGILTPIASALIVTGGTTMLVTTHAGLLHLLDSRMALFELVVMAAGLAILGPGATSFDARLFGRREVPIGDKPSDVS